MPSIARSVLPLLLVLSAALPSHAQALTTQPRIQVLAMPSGAPSAASAHRKEHSKFTVDAAVAAWVDTGEAVVAGDTLDFTTSGEITLAGHTLSPDGMTRGWRDMLRRFPSDTANAGALLGRIGDNAAAVSFTIGSRAGITAGQSGNLFLRVNASAEMPAMGTVTVDLHVKPAGNTSASPLAASTAVNPFGGLAPHILDDLPRRVADNNGAPGDAVNFALLGTEQQVRDAFDRAGWVEVDADTSSAILHGLLSTLQHKPYLQVPMSTLYLFGRPQDLSFARASAIAVASERHHLRCWKTTTVVNGAPLWVGAATHDVGFERDQRNGQVTHRIAPEIDLERDFLRDSFQASGSASAMAYFSPIDPVREARTATGGSFTTDGRILLVQLR